MYGAERNNKYYGVPCPKGQRVKPLTYLDWLQANVFNAPKREFHEWFFQNNRACFRDNHTFYKAVRKGTKFVSIKCYRQLYEFLLKQGVVFPENFSPTELFEPIKIVENF